MAKKHFTDKYQVTVTPATYNVDGFGTVDLKNLTFKEADALFNAGFPFLKKKSTDQEPEAKS